MQAVHYTEEDLPIKVMEVIFGGKSLVGDSSNAQKWHAMEVFFAYLGWKQLASSKEIVHFSDVDLHKDVLYSYDDPLVISVPIN